MSPRSRSIRVTPALPYDLKLSIEIFRSDRDLPTVIGDRLELLVQMGEDCELIDLEQSGDPDHAELNASTVARKGRSMPLEVLRDRIERMMNLRLDLIPFYEQVADDPVLGSLVPRLRGLKPSRTPTPFQALVVSIAEQQISLVAAQAITQRVVQRYGTLLELEGHAIHAFPTPRQLAKADVGSLKTCGLSTRKAEYILGVAKEIDEGRLDLDALEFHTTEEVVERLRAVRGVGLWTAEMSALRGLSKFDALPADDLGLRRIISEYYARGKGVTSEQARTIAKGWGPWAGLAAYYLVVASILDLKVESKRAKGYHAAARKSSRG
ncbi:MAG TPA: DNA-3-methyladenine glycosylase [Methanomassiliicoccales archaeon]|nr:DNA-3-methyladenine glycosylase [Methanomassiliicoccales archaeon]